jgi:hypothetical protein
VMGFPGRFGGLRGRGWGLALRRGGTPIGEGREGARLGDQARGEKGSQEPGVSALFEILSGQ